MNNPPNVGMFIRIKPDKKHFNSEAGFVLCLRCDPKCSFYLNIRYYFLTISCCYIQSDGKRATFYIEVKTYKI